MKIVILLGLVLTALISTVTASCHCDENFSGFGTEPGKCGCCPWPCCCKCVPGEDCPTTTTQDCGCINLAFIIDGSGSIGSFDWQKELDFVQTLVNIVFAGSNYAECGEQIYVSVVQFGNNATVNILHEGASSVVINPTTVPQVKKATNIVEGMERTISDVFSKMTDCEPCAVILTDGRANFRQAEIGTMGEMMRETVNDNLACIAITSEVDEDQLKEICDPVNTYTVLDFDELASVFIEKLPEVLPTLDPAAVECVPEEEVCFCCCTPEQYFGSGFKGYYGYSHY